jgi:histidinol-phosphate aminotransferase
MQIPWAVDSLALTAAEAALADQAYLREIVAQIRIDVRGLSETLRATSLFRVHPTDANFLLLDLREVPWSVLEPVLARRGLVVRRRADMPTCLRVTSMLPEDNRRLLGAFAEVGS